MKRKLFLVILLLLLTFSISAFQECTTPISLNVGQTHALTEEERGIWQSSNEQIAIVKDNAICALSNGTADLIIVTNSGELLNFTITVGTGEYTPPAVDQPTNNAQNNEEKETQQETEKAQDEQTAKDVQAETNEQTEKEETPSLPLTFELDDDMPPLVQDAVTLALSEWSENRGKTFSRLGKYNKYSRWQCGTGPKCNIGWCGAFLGYCFDTAHVPMDSEHKSVPHESGEAYAVHAAGVGKIYTGFKNMNRLTDVPRAGYPVIYGEKGGYQYLHVGLVTHVLPLGDEKYIVSTVEGNVSSRIKRYTYLYDKNGGKNNFLDCPEAYRTDDNIDQYTKHNKDWSITTFCQTWF